MQTFLFWSALQWLVSKRFFYSGYNPLDINLSILQVLLKPLRRYVSPGLMSGILWYSLIFSWHHCIDVHAESTLPIVPENNMCPRWTGFHWCSMREFLVHIFILKLLFAYLICLQIHLVHNINNNKPRGYAFVEYEHERDMHGMYKT